MHTYRSPTCEQVNVTHLMESGMPGRQFLAQIVLLYYAKMGPVEHLEHVEQVES